MLVDKSNGVENRNISELLYLVNKMKSKKYLYEFQLILALCKLSVITLFLLRFLFFKKKIIYFLILFIFYLFEVSDGMYSNHINYFTFLSSIQN